MAINVADNFSYKGGKPLDNRIKYASVAAMVAVPEADLYDGCLAYVTATKKNYQFDSTNTVDVTLGKWRELETGGGGTKDYNALSNRPQIAGVTLSGNKSASDLGLADAQTVATRLATILANLAPEFDQTQEYQNAFVTYEDKLYSIVSHTAGDPWDPTAATELVITDGMHSILMLLSEVSMGLSGVKHSICPVFSTSQAFDSGDLVFYTDSLTNMTRLYRFITTHTAGDPWDSTEVVEATLEDLLKEILNLLAEEFDSSKAYAVGDVVWRLNNHLSAYLWKLCKFKSAHTAGDPWDYAEVDEITVADLIASSGGNITAGTGLTKSGSIMGIKEFQGGDMDDVIPELPAGNVLVSVADAFNKGDIYSTTEKMIGQWSDGKPLYQRTWDLGSNVVISQSGATTLTAIDGTGIDRMIKCFGTTSDVDYSAPLMVIHDSNASAVSAIALRSNNGVSVRYITIQYTKTTDSAVSIGEETEYSTTEKIVGTWIDGKPLYQKSIYISAFPTTETEFNHNVTNIEQVIDVSAIMFVQSGGVRVFKGRADIYADNTVITIVGVAGYNNFDGYATLQYTKTTD